VYLKELFVYFEQNIQVESEEITVESSIQLFEIMASRMAQPSPIRSTSSSSPLGENASISDEPSIKPSPQSQFGPINSIGDSPYRYGYCETPDCSEYFVPLIWKTIYYLQPNYVCWNR